MYSHFLGYNPDSIKFIEGQSCENCQILIEQLQQNELLMMLRDNVLNPEKVSIFYCPEYNRFKLLNRVQRPIEAGSSEMVTKTEIRYLNYYHFRTNIKKMTTKQRVGFTSTHSEESFALSFGLIGREMMIMDPARGRYCQHFAFTDLREYYLNYDPSTNLCSCPIQGCS